jgi:hypothetical protein
LEAVRIFIIFNVKTQHVGFVKKTFSGFSHGANAQVIDQGVGGSRSGTKTSGKRAAGKRSASNRPRAITKSTFETF